MSSDPYSASSELIERSAAQSITWSQVCIASMLTFVIVPAIGTLLYRFTPLDEWWIEMVGYSFALIGTDIWTASQWELAVGAAAVEWMPIVIVTLAVFIVQLKLTSIRKSKTRQPAT